METLKQALMRQHELSPEEADFAINEARKLVALGEDPEEIMKEELGLGPAYVFDLLGVSSSARVV